MIDTSHRPWVSVLLVVLWVLIAGVPMATVVGATAPERPASTRPAAVAAPSASAPPASINTSCTTVVTHDAFRDDNATVVALADGGPATATTQNTQVEIREANGFYRVRMDNPNGYCVHFQVVVSARAMDPASLPGQVESTNGTTTATWDAVHNFSTSRTYTRIEATVPASTEVQFAPSTVRVASLSWASQQASTAEGVVRRVRESVFGARTVTKRHYNITADADEVPVTYTVRLQDPHSGAQIEEYHALYTTDDGETWHPVPTDTTAPVYRTEASDSTAVRFTFNEAARVRFTANPNPIDDAQRQWRSYTGGASTIADSLLDGLFGDEEGT